MPASSSRAATGRVELGQLLDRASHLPLHVGPQHLLITGGELALNVHLLDAPLESRRQLFFLLLSPALEELHGLLLLLQVPRLDSVAGAGALRSARLLLLLVLKRGLGHEVWVCFHGGRLLLLDTVGVGRPGFGGPV